jgi:hypothetical protein
MRDDSWRAAVTENSYCRLCSATNGYSSVQLTRRLTHLATPIRPGLVASLGGVCRMLQTNFGECVFYELR